MRVLQPQSTYIGNKAGFAAVSCSTHAAAEKLLLQFRQDSR